MPPLLTDRETDVLITVVEEYITGAMPVGSRTVSKVSGLSLSAASIRNTMVDLADKGFLSQPHTSAGRVPTVRAFRFYLDNSGPMELSPDEQCRIGSNLASAGLELSDLLSRASRLVSKFSNQISLVLSPSRCDVRWREIDFSLVRPRLILAVLILDGGMVQNKLVEVDEDITQDDLEKFRNFLNDHYKGKTLSEARTLILQELVGAGEHLHELYRRALRLARHAFDNALDREVYVDGTVNMLDHAEFNDIARMREVLKLLEERSRLLELLDRTINAEQGLKITLGEESDLETLGEVGVISSAFGRADMAQGVVGVIGPMRMDYGKIVPVVDFISKELTSMLKHRF